MSEMERRVLGRELEVSNLEDFTQSSEESDDSRTSNNKHTGLERIKSPF